MTPTQKPLSEKRLVCICCGDSATPLRRKEGEPNVMAVSMTMYRKGAGKGQQKAAHKVNVCEPCFVRALAPSMFGASREAKKLLEGFRDSLSDCYSALVDDEARG